MSFKTGIKISAVFQGFVQKLEVSYAACLSTEDTKFPNRSNVCFIIQIDCSNYNAYNDKSTIITGLNGYKSLAKTLKKIAIILIDRVESYKNCCTFQTYFTHRASWV